MTGRTNIASQALPNRRFRRLLPAVASAAALAAAGGQLAAPPPARAERPARPQIATTSHRVAVVPSLRTRDDTDAARVTAP
jgi:hypothetical protein